MATAYRSSQSVTNGTAGTSVTVTKPSGIVDTGTNPARDQLIAFIAAVGAPTFTAPAGWTLITSAVDAGSGVTLKAYRKLASSEGASWTWTLGSSARNWGWVGAYTGVDPDDVVADSDSDLTLTGSTALTPGAATFPASGQGVVAAAAVRVASGAATTWTTSSGTERADLSTNGGAGTDIAGTATDSVNAAGDAVSYGPTCTASQTQTAGVLISLTLNPYFVPYGAKVRDAGIVVEAALGVDPDGDSSTWTWTDLTAYVHQPAKLELVHGRANRTAVADPSRMTFSLKNLNGEFTSPSGAYAAYMVMNLPFRVRLNGFGVAVGTTGYHRGTTFLASLRPRWDTSANFAVVDVVAQGRLRRQQQRSDVLKSAAYTAIQRMSATAGYVAPIAHWPFEDESDAISAASAVAGVDPIAVTGVTFAGDSTVVGAAPLAQLTTTSAISTNVPAYADTGTWTVMYALAVPSEPASEIPIIDVITPGTANRWRLSLTPGTTALTVQIFSGSTVLFNTGVALTEAAFYGFGYFYTFTVTQNGADIDFLATAYGPDGGAGQSGTISSQTVGTAQSITIGPIGGLSGWGFGHLAVHVEPGADGSLTSPAVVDGNSGDWPWSRFQNLCIQQGVPYIMDQSDNQDLTMGPQPVATFMDLIREAEAVEGCVLNDSGEFFGETGTLWFPARGDRDNIDATMTLDTSAGQVAPGFEPALDDQDIVNDFEASRTGGSSARVTDEVSIAAAGRYRQGQTFNVEDDQFLTDLAGWRVNLGTVAGMRFPSVAWNLRRSPELAQAWMACRLFHRIDITNPPTQYPPDDIQTILEGYTEVLSSEDWTVRANLSPYRPNSVFELADDTGDTSDYVGRLAGDQNAAIRGAVTSSATSIAFDPNRYRWVTHPTGVVLPGTSGNYVSTPDDNALDVTGDIDIRADVTIDNWTPAGTSVFVAKWGAAGNRSYLFQLTTGGLLELAWSANGTAPALADSTVAVPITEGRLAVRATLDVDNGAAGRTVTFYTASSIDGSWTQLGSSVTQATTTSIFSGNLAVEIGSQSIGTVSLLAGIVHAAKILNGIGGSEVANPDFTAHAGATSFADVAGRTWTVNGTAVITESDLPLDIRLGGEVVTASAIATTPATYVAAGALSHADNASVAPALYSGAAAGDLIGVVARVRSTSAGTLTTPSGYTRLPIKGLSSTSKLQVYAKAHSGSESAPTVAISGGSAGDTVSAFTFGLRGTPTSLTDLTDIVVDSYGLLNASAQNVAYPGLYPQTEGCVVLAIGGKDDDWTSVAALTGMTEAVDGSTTTGNDQGLVMDYVIQRLPAVVNEGSFVVTGGASAVSHGITLAIAGGYQTATVTRSVNGVVKAQTAGTKIEVDDAFSLGM